MRTVVINLDRQPERLAAFRAANPHLDAERFAAADGTLPVVAEKFAALCDPANPPVFSAGNQGNALSHIAIWHQVAEGSQDTLILEDDAVMGPGLPAPVCDLFVLGWNFDAPCVVRAEQCEMEIRAQQGQMREWLAEPTWPSSVVWLPLLFSCGTLAYVLTPLGARKLLDAVLPLNGNPVPTGVRGVPMANTGIDIAMTRGYRKLGAMVCVPPLAVSPNFKE